MNILLDILIPIPFLIAGLYIYYKRKNMTDIEYNQEMEKLRKSPTFTDPCKSNEKIGYGYSFDYTDLNH